MQGLPEKKQRGQWVQTERAAHEAWATLTATAPKAAQLMHILTARVGEHNAVVVSQRTLSELMKCSRRTVQRAVDALVQNRWIEVRQIGDNGTVNAHILNDRVVWSGPRDGIRFSLFSATVIISDEEQPDREELDRQEPLQKLPLLSENQLPTGPGLPPPSQPFLHGMEPELPASGESSSRPSAEIPTDVANAIRWWQKLDAKREDEWRRIIGETVEYLDRTGEQATRRRSLVELAVEAYRMERELSTYYDDLQAATQS